MFWNVAVLGAVGAVDPAGIGAVVSFLSRTDPRRVLIAYLLGGIGVSLIAGVVALFVLHGVGAGGGSSVPPEIDIAVGVLALAVAGIVDSGLSERIRARREERRATTSGPDERAGSDPQAVTGAEARTRSGGFPGGEKLPPRVRGALENGSPWVAWVAGVAYGMPGAYYLAAIAVVLKSGSAAPAQIAALVIFNLLLFSVAIVPLVFYTRDPAGTQSSVDQLHAWVQAHQRLVVASIAGVIGAYLVVSGITKL